MSSEVNETVLPTIEEEEEMSAGSTTDSEEELSMAKRGGRYFPRPRTPFPGIDRMHFSALRPLQIPSTESRVQRPALRENGTEDMAVTPKSGYAARANTPIDEVLCSDDDDDTCSDSIDSDELEREFESLVNADKDAGNILTINPQALMIRGDDTRKRSLSGADEMVPPPKVQCLTAQINTPEEDVFAGNPFADDPCEHEPSSAMICATPVSPERQFCEILAERTSTSGTMYKVMWRASWIHASRISIEDVRDIWSDHHNRYGRGWDVLG